MEKFGLFDLLEKLGGNEPEKRAQTKNENPTYASGGAADISGTPPQLKMNDKFKDFIVRHDAAAAAVRAACENEKRKAAQKTAPKSSAAKKRGRPKKPEKSALTENINGGAVINAGKKRGRPKKSEKSALTEEISAKAAVPVQKKRETLKSAEKTGFPKTTPDDAVTARKKREGQKKCSCGAKKTVGN